MNSLLHLAYRMAHGAVGRGNALLGVLSPLVLRIRITKKCNLSCSFCYLGRNLNTPESEHLTLEEWKRLFDSLPRWTILDITGAEPFLAKDFKEVLTMALDRKFKISLTTNGLIDSDEIIDLMVEKKMTFLMLSIDGMSEYHNEIRGNDHSFKQIVSFCEKLKRKKSEEGSHFPRLTIKTTITNDNARDLPELNRFVFNELGADAHSFNLMFQNEARGGLELETDPAHERFSKGNDWKYKKESIELIKKSLKEVMAQSKSNGWEINFKPELDFDDIFRYIDDPSLFGVKSCHRSHSVITMYYDGALAPCDLALDVGNIRELEFDLKRIWKQDAFQNFLRHFNPHFNASCEGCCLVKQEPKG